MHVSEMKSITVHHVNQFHLSADLLDMRPISVPPCIIEEMKKRFLGSACRRLWHDPRNDTSCHTLQSNA